MYSMLYYTTPHTGLAYAGAQRAEVKELLEVVVANTDGGVAAITEVSMAALSLGLVFVGSCDDDIGSVLLQRLMEASEDELNHTASRFLCLGLGLLYLGKGEQADTVLEAIRTIEHKRGKYAEVIPYLFVYNISLLLLQGANLILCFCCR